MRWTLSFIKKALHRSFRSGEGIRIRRPDGEWDHTSVRPDGTIVIFSSQPGRSDHGAVYYQEDMDAVARTIYRDRKNIVFVNGRQIRD